MEAPFELPRFMGRWYVLANIPTVFDKDTVNNMEDYTLDEAGKTVDVNFTYYSKDLKKKSELKQRAAVKNEAGTEWAISPKLGVYLPLGIPYLIVYCAEDYSTTIIGVPDRSYVWIMARTPTVEAALQEELIRKTQAMGYDISKLVVVPQTWTDVQAIDGAEAPEEVR
uniref:Lipocalin/cytosolic fatty-acid binding domain-containing protein n=1 Tax=Strombidinopsis acuminata TaxID=141414 RepID=A0A7S3RM64_9SPIT